MHASVKGMHVGKFNPMLTLGRIYAFGDFKVVKNTTRCHPVSNDIKVIFLDYIGSGS